MERDPRSFVWDARDSIDTVLRFVADASLNDYLRDGILRAAVERHLIIVGEALRQLAKLNPEMGSQIPDLAKIVAFRNRLVHGYAGVDPNAVWVILEGRLPELRKALDRLLAEIDRQSI